MKVVEQEFHGGEGLMGVEEVGVEEVKGFEACHETYSCLEEDIFWRGRK